MENRVYKRARCLKGLCEVCHRYVRKGEYFTTTGTDGHGALTGLAHNDCPKEARDGKVQGF